MSAALTRFVRESNAIEGILRDPTDAEIEAHIRFLECDPLDIPALERFVNVVQPGAALRRRAGMNVRVGRHMPPPGGPEIAEELVDILSWDGATPWERHVAYETLHPFMDGNGRSGRALWLLDMGGIENAPLGFLHHAYYQALENSSGRL